ncbi:class I SAM-dependent methyltransferase [Embleya sp. AB8]|uniref:class I SAM-dependent methyltransferase n=1 Tax=Embleya sp. AB8 TaxID=3156304 RepID=UPI003C727968
MAPGTERMARAFDDLADEYDDAYHDEVARALVGWSAPTGTEAVADVACGTGAVALAVVAAGGGGGVPVLAVDLSAGMVAAGRARAERAGVGGAIDWRVAPAVPLPVADGSLDVILCASSLHFLGTPALADWRRALRPGGRVGCTLPVASTFQPRGVYAELVASDLPLPETAENGRQLADHAGFTDTAARLLDVGSRRVVLIRGRTPA